MISNPQSRSTFPLKIDDNMYLKYSHKDLIHQFLNRRSCIGFPHTIEYDVPTDYLNNNSVHFFVSQNAPSQAAHPIQHPKTNK
jgi:hypothetical protein